LFYQPVFDCFLNIATGKRAILLDIPDIQTNLGKNAQYSEKL